MRAEKTLLAFILSGAASLAYAKGFTLFATGVNPEDSSTYYNIDQGREPTCWAASGSNVVAHWQDYHAASVPAGTPTGTAVYDTFLRIYHTQNSGQSDTLYQWWLGHHSALAMGGALPQEGWESLGGYYEDAYTMEEVDDMAWRYAEIWEQNLTTDLSRAIYYALNNGHAMTINIPRDRHAITVYGASFNSETGLITSLYVVDSSGGSFAEANEKMTRIRVGKRGNKLCLLGYYEEGKDEDEYLSLKYLEDVAFLGNTKTDTLAFILSGTPIPEPSAFGLFAGLGVLVFAASRRRRY